MEFTDKEKNTYSIDCIILSIIIIICVHIVHTYLNGKSFYKTIQITGHLVIFSLMLLILCIFLLKIKLFLEEFFMNTKNNSVIDLLKSLNFNTPSWIVIGVTIMVFLFIISNFDYDLRVIQLYPLGALLALIFSIFLLYTVKINDCKNSQIETVFNSGGLDAGSAMAGSYFYGYLKIMLPSSGGSERVGILSSIETFEANKKIKIPVKKLFILIPTSSYISPDLKEMTGNRLEYIGQLETTALDRAGVKNRKYHNSVYKIHQREPYGHPNDTIPIVVEGATPLKTYSETRTKSSRYGGVYKEYNSEIVKNFYLTLKNLLDDNPDCRDFCELVYYDDEGDSRVNAADVLIQRIKHLSKYD